MLGVLLFFGEFISTNKEIVDFQQISVSVSVFVIMEASLEGDGRKEQSLQRFQNCNTISLKNLQTWSFVRFREAFLKQLYKSLQFIFS